MELDLSLVKTEPEDKGYERKVSYVGRPGLVGYKTFFHAQLN